VRTVVDGNTIDVAGYGRVRLAGVRAPKLGRGGLDGEPFARDARERLEGIVTHRFVRLEFPSVSSRSAAYVLLEDGTFVNALLVREGLARLAGRPAGARGDDLQRAQQQAMGARRGIWGARQRPIPHFQFPNSSTWDLGVGIWALSGAPHHSALSATSGSTRVARRAGKTHAQSATIERIAVIDANVAGSRGVI
jgi:micrococcal nuclease